MIDDPTQAQIKQAYDELITEGVLNENSTIKYIRITLAEAFDLNHDNNEILKFISSLSFGQTGGEGKRKSRKKSKKYHKKSKKYRKKSKKHHKKSKKSRRKRR
jgi:hypothetical protein